MPAATTHAARAFIDACSLEVSAKAMPALHAEAARIAPGTTISIPYLASEDDDARIAAARRVRELGLQPMPHLSARRIGSLAALERFIARAVGEAVSSSACWLPVIWPRPPARLPTPRPSSTPACWNAQASRWLPSAGTRKAIR